MKKFVAIFAFLMVFISVFAQNTVITDDPGYSPHSSAMLDVNSVNKGFLVPRVTALQMGLINPAAIGLLVYNTDMESFCYYNGESWINLSNQKLPGVAGPNDALFAIANGTDTIFAVYPEGVRINVGDGNTKGTGSKGGFAVGGFTTGKGFQEFMRITTDSVRVYVDNNPTKGTGSKGGFAVGGFTTGKLEPVDFFRINTKNYSIGHESGLKITDGQYNCFLGYQAGKEVLKAESNVFVGYQAGMNTTGDGEYWHQGGLNVFIGYRAGVSNTNGGQNIAIGYEAMDSNKTGNFNIGMGIFALHENIDGTYNIAMGKSAMHNNDHGDENLAIGTYALSENTEGNLNVALGGGCLGLNTTGEENIGIGVSAVFHNKTGTGNVGIGKFALDNYLNGNYNTALGHEAGSQNSSVDYSNTISIGYNAEVSSSNSINIGNYYTHSAKTAVSWTSFSDGRFKENLKNDVPGLSFIMKLQPVTYNLDIHKLNEYKGIKDEKDWEGKYDVEKIKFSGFVAQDVEKAAGEIGYDFSGIDKTGVKDGDTYGLRYSDFTVPMVKAIQEQQALIEELKKEIESLKKEMEQLKK